METNKLILKQVALKGAVQLTKNQFKVDELKNKIDKSQDDDLFEKPTKKFKI